MNHSNKSKDTRPEINKIVMSEDVSDEENFQNTVLRQIIKMKNDLFNVHFKTYIASKKIAFKDLGEEKQMDFIDRSFRQDLTLRNELRGIVIGHFTIEEYHQYIKMKGDLNKRIINIIKERIFTNLDSI